jgi:thymidine kinase
MKLTLILGPMKSGKSFDLIRHFAPLAYTKTTFELYQPLRNVRDSFITSRNGVNLEATKVASLVEALESRATVIGVDEIHMFEPTDVAHVEMLLRRGKDVVASGLDTDYRGRMFDIIRGLLELGPHEVRYRRSVCERCQEPEAVYSQVFEGGIPVTSGMPAVIPDDGTFTYMPACRQCFIKK